MKGLCTILSNRKLYWLWTLITTDIFILASGAFAPAFLAWENLALIGITAVLQGLAAAVLILLFVTSGKSTISKKAKILSAVGGFFGFETVFFTILAIVNTDGLKNLKALFTALNTVGAIIMVLFVITLFRASNSGFKVLQRLMAVICAAVFVCLAFIPISSGNALSFKYSIYRTIKHYDGQIESTGVYCGFAPSTKKLQPTDNIDATFESRISLAGNEREGIQLMLASDTDGNKAKVSVSDFTDKNGNTMKTRIFTERYTAVPGHATAFSDVYADALIPYNNTEITLTKNNVSAFYIETVSAVNQAAGEYSARVTVETGNASKDYELKATVWSFSLPEESSCKTALGDMQGLFSELNYFEGSAYGWDSSTRQFTDEGKAALKKTYIDYLLEHKMSPYDIPYDILDERADTYMSSPRVSSFRIPYSQDDATLVKYYEKVTSNPVWAEKAYFYPIDEPDSEEDYNAYIRITDRLNKLCPGYNMVTPFYTTKLNADGKELSMIDVQSGRSSILCGVTYAVTKDDTLQKMKESRYSVGSKLWWYVCCGPTDNIGYYGNSTIWNNMFIQMEAIRHRELFWQQKQNDITGFLYWSTMYYQKGNPWETSKTWDNYDCAGDGCLIYPGGYIGIDEPVGTIRLKNVCDGIEDYDYLTLAEKKFGKEWVDEKTSLITTDINTFNLDSGVLSEVRDSIGKALSE